MERNEDSGEEELAYVPGRPKRIRSSAACAASSRSGWPTPSRILPDRERLVMTLYYYEEMTMREIGLALGVVESRSRRCTPRRWCICARAGCKDLAGGRAERTGAKPSAREEIIAAEGSKRFWEGNSKEGTLDGKTLKQDEIDALFEAARSSTPEAARPRCGPRSCPTTSPRRARSRPSSCAPSAC
jgi:hypothetical protein